MATRSVATSNISEGKKAKTLIPWRDPEKGPILKLSLLKLVSAKQLHMLKGTPGIDDKWRLLTVDILRQPEWSFINPAIDAPIEFRTFKDQFKDICDGVCAVQGWGKHGSCKNLSGKEGDLDEIALLVRQIEIDL